MKTIKDLEVVLAEYRNGERGLPTYEELIELVNGEGHDDRQGAGLQVLRSHPRGPLPAG
ncbi:hypothetical protein [Paraburkholderia fungorum]|uniref:hypothetical protein n=1 Tax=Paraburkholderia fungorum TaxID=134537 RepID=UPI001C1F0D80|nr:hypothetical protein [Paraburkholderia fungorum]MBU7436525.1 hypothetical protein [Paraburkholderia fungorum]